MKLKKNPKKIINKIGLCLIAVASMLVTTACFGLGGEPTPPKNLLK